MSEKFTASNGVEVETDVHGCVTVTGLNSLRDESQALREFFLHERDQELGRWKSPTGFYVYPLGEINGERVVQVLDELNGQSHSFAEGGGFKGVGSFYEAANDYFAAHPAPKPWHDAKPGEVWAVKTKHNDQERPVFVNSDGDFENAEEYFHPEFRDITAGRRLWPEEL